MQRLQMFFFNFITFLTFFKLFLIFNVFYIYTSSPFFGYCCVLISFRRAISSTNFSDVPKTKWWAFSDWPARMGD